MIHVGRSPHWPSVAEESSPSSFARRSCMLQARLPLEGKRIEKVEMDGWLIFKDQLCHLGFAGRWRVGTVIRVPVDPTVHPVPMLLGTKSTSRDVTTPRSRFQNTVKIPGVAVQPSSYLFVGYQTDQPVLGSSVHRALSMRPKQ